MKYAIRAGFNFGLTSGIITTLGLMVGLNSSTQSHYVVIGGILTIAVADALSDSIGMHFAIESQNSHTTKEIWEATLSTFIYKFIFSSMFIVPILLLELNKAVLISILFGVYLIIVNSLCLARQQEIDPVPVILEHVVLTIGVVIAAHFIGVIISIIFT
jgi:VIT1/CCC1 family predicted Fe2+/Mn2+ transporter